MTPLTSCDTAPLFRPLSRQLVGLLRALPADDWLRPTVAGAWRVRDVAAHLLDGQLRKLSAQRDVHLTPPDRPIQSDQDLARFINAVNAAGVAFGARLSTAVLTDLLQHAGEQLADLVTSLDPHGPAIYAVSWAGEQQSENWMDTGREYTEHWHHQMQIRDATGRPRLLAPRWLEPLLAISVRALPYAYAGVRAAPGTTITLAVTGETTGSWTLVRVDDRWQIWRGRPAAPDAMVTIAADDVWRMFYNALAGDALRRRVTVAGDADLAAPLLRARSVIV
ncbi:MAG: maleylpyruvate isomerase family mycothiol-dependent enzyme [Acidobacteriota bacterium]|nr:maleylpyruvate isomerase family mycothiol-dependent enzyme [Acidobacteriota bacterium]